MSYIASGICRPSYTNEVTEDRKRIGYARVFVEVDIDSEMTTDMGVEVSRTGSQPHGLPSNVLTARLLAILQIFVKKERKVWVLEGSTANEMKVNLWGESH